jgi:hypothetical protein
VTEIESGKENYSCNGKVNRAEEVLKQLSLDHLNKEERQQIEKTCTDYHDIFHLPGEVLTSTIAVKHEIRLEPGAQPVNVKQYRLPEAQKQEARRQVEELRRGGIIEESNSPWNSPLLVVKKRQTRPVRKSGG